MDKVQDQIDGNTLYLALLESDLFIVYRKAFEKVTGQTLSLIHADTRYTPPAEISRCNSRFCSFMLDQKVCEHRCSEFILQLSRRINHQAITASCEANITTTLIPVTVKGKIVAYLRSGLVRVSNNHDDESFLNRVKQSLPPSTGKEIENIYNESRVFTKSDYNSQITLLGAFALQLSDLAINLSEKCTSQHDIIDSTKSYIQTHLSEKICLDTLAERVNITSSYLCKQFKKATGLTIIEYVNRHRIEKAKKLLVQKDEVKVIEIAYETGFQSLSQFNRSFLRYVGISPTEYKNKHHSAGTH